MKTRQGIVRGIDEDGNRIEREATAIICEECEAAVFWLFVVEGHTHLQCVTCGTSFCESHQCDEEIAT